MEPSTVRTSGNLRVAPPVLSVAWSLLLVAGLAGPTGGQDTPVESRPVDADLARVVVTSDPTGRSVTLDGRELEPITPVALDLLPGRYSLVVNAEGYQPLSHELVVRAGQQLELGFILLRTPPEPPTPAELRSPDSPDGTGGPDGWPAGAVEDEAVGQAVMRINDSCLECHPSIPGIHSRGIHKTISCEECHSPYSDHVNDGKMIAAMQVVRGKDIQVMCLTCHDSSNRQVSQSHIRKVAFNEHLRKLNVRRDHGCDQCHHVHAPMKWMHEAREMVGLPEVMASEPLLNEATAMETPAKYNSYLQTFLVFPLAPGVIGATIFPDTNEFPSSELLYSGLVLVAGSYVLGKVFYARDLAEIKAINTVRTAANLRAQEYNRRVETAMNEHNRAVVLWVEESEGRGRVVVHEQ